METLVRIIVVGLFSIGIYYASDMLEFVQQQQIQAGAAHVKN